MTLTDSPIENFAFVALADGDLAVQQAVDLGLRERHGLVGRADEAGDAGVPLTSPHESSLRSMLTST